MPGITISLRFDPPSEEAFGNFARIYMEYLHIRLNVIPLNAEVIIILLSKVPEIAQQTAPWFETLRQAVTELKDAGVKRTGELRGFYGSYRADVDRYSPYDAAAWDRFFASSVEVIAPHLPQLEQLVQRIEALVSKATVGEIEAAGERLWEFLKEDVPESSREALRVLGQLLTAEGLEAHHAKLVSDERRGYISMFIGDFSLNARIILDVLSQAPETGQRNAAWLERLRQAASELYEYTKKMTGEFQGNSELDIYGSSPYNAAAWDRFLAVSAEAARSSYLPQLEQLVRRFQAVTSEAPVSELDVFDERFLRALKNNPESSRKALDRLGLLLSAGSFEAYYAEFLRLHGQMRL